MYNFQNDEIYFLYCNIIRQIWIISHENFDSLLLKSMECDYYYPKLIYPSDIFKLSDFIKNIIWDLRNNRFLQWDKFILNINTLLVWYRWQNEIY